MEDNGNISHASDSRLKPLSERKHDLLSPLENELVRSPDNHDTPSKEEDNPTGAALIARSFSDHTKAAQEILLESFTQQNSQSNLPPWLRTQSKLVSTSNADNDEAPAVDSMLRSSSLQNNLLGFPTSAAPTAQTPHQHSSQTLLSVAPRSYLSGTLAILNDVAAEKGLGLSNLPAGSLSVDNLSTLETQGHGQVEGMSAVSSGQIHLPVMAHSGPLPSMSGASLNSNCQSSSSFVRSGSASTLNSAAQKAAFSTPSLGLLGGPIQPEYHQQYNTQDQYGQMQHGTVSCAVLCCTVLYCTLLPISCII